jgi:hypothetical protein
MMVSQDIDGNKLGKDAEDAKKHISNKRGAVNFDEKGIIKIINSFYPSLPLNMSPQEIMESVELTFILKFKSFPLQNHEMYMSLF